MSREEILTMITEVIRDEFEDDTLDVTDQTTAADVDGWDSLAHLSLMHEMEGKFHVKFTMGEIRGLKNIGELINAIQKHLG